MRKPSVKSPACQNGGIKELFVARTIAKNEKGLDRFARSLAWNLGSFDAEIKTIESMHLVVLGGIGGILSRLCLSAKQLREFSNGLDQYITQELGTTYSTVVTVDEEKPLIAVGDRQNKIALHICSDENLRMQRSVVYAYAAAHLGEFPQLEQMPFWIEIGRINHRPLYYLRNGQVERLVNEQVILPSEISLNGLSVYMGRVHAREQYIRFSGH